MRLIGSGLLIAIAVVLVCVGFGSVAPFRHAFGVLNGTVSPSSGNLGVVAGEFLIYTAVAGVAFLCLRSGFRLLDSRTDDRDLS